MEVYLGFITVLVSFILTAGVLHASESGITIGYIIVGVCVFCTDVVLISMLLAIVYKVLGIF